MRILVCDDDILFTKKLKQYLSEFFHKIKVKSYDILLYNNGKDLLADSGRKDIIFLDMEMPDINGICVGNTLKKSNADVIIFVITSHIEYLDNAMRFQVFRYLSKPLDKQRLFHNMNDALQLYHLSATKISIETKQGIYTVSSSDIVMVEAYERKITVYTINNTYESIHNMQYWTDVLNMHCFFLTHRSFIVNLEHVSDFDHTLIHLCGQKFRAYLTRRKYTQFREAYLLYLEGTQ